MTTLMQASHQWSSRPDDERFVSLPDLQAKVSRQRQNSVGKVVSSRKLQVRPSEIDPLRGIEIVGESGRVAVPNHWSFTQMASLSGGPASYLRKLPAPLVADCMNYGFRFNRDAEDVGVLLSKT